MRTTINLDEELLARASEATGVTVHDGLRALVQREAARAAIMLGGSDPDAKAPPRRRYG